MGVEFTGGAIDWNFENNNQSLTRDRLIAGEDLVLFHAIGTRTFALLSLGVDRIKYDQNTQLDSVDYQIGIGLRKEGPGQIEGEIQIGYEFLNFDHAPVVQPAGSALSSGGKGNAIFFVLGNLRWKPTSRFTLDVSPFRRIKQGALFNASTYVRTGVNVQAKKKIGVSTSIFGKFSISDNDFTDDPQNRRDLRLGSVLGLEYRTLHWLSMRIDYRYQKRHSNFSRFDYYANTFMVSIQGIL